MTPTNDNSSERWIAFGVLTIISEIGLTLSNKYAIGNAGPINGIWLNIDNRKNIKNKNA